MGAARSEKNTIVETDEAKKALATRRLGEIIHQIGDELGGQHGWKTYAAQVLGLSRAHVSRVLAGHPIGSPTVTRVSRLLRLDARFFAEPDDAIAGSMLDAITPLGLRLTGLSPEDRRDEEERLTSEKVAGQELSEGVRSLLEATFMPDREARMRKLARQIMSAAGADDDATVRRLALELAAVVLG